MSELRGHGVVKMNPLGPHFYVDVEEGEKPTGMVDLMTDVMNTMLAEVDADHGWPITHGHIKGHEPITKVSWEPDPETSYGIDYQVESPAVSQTWYSQAQIREYNLGNPNKRDIIEL
jgi:hypothetical protein